MRLSTWCVEGGKVPRGLRIQYQEVYLMNSPTIAKTHATLANTYKRTELDVCKALIEHYVLIQKDSEEALREVSKMIENQLKLKILEAGSTCKASLILCYYDMGWREFSLYF